METKIITITTLICLIFSTNIKAETALKTVTQAADSTDDLSLELGLELDNQLIRDEFNKVNGINNVLLLEFDLPISKMQKINFNSEISHQKIENTGTKSNLEFIEIGYSRKLQFGFLNTFLDAALYYQYPVRAGVREEEKQKGSVFLFFESESQILSNLLVEGEMQLVQLFNTTSGNDVVSNSFYIQVNPIVSISDFFSLKLPINLAFEFYNGNLGYGYSSTTISPTLGFGFSQDAELEVYAEFTPYNGTEIATNFENEINYGANFIYSVF